MISTNDFTSYEVTGETSILLDIFDAGSGSKTLSVPAGMKFTYLVILKEQVSLDLRIESIGEGAEITLRGLVLAKDASKISLTAHAHLMHNHATADLHLVSFLQDGSETEIDGGVDLHEGCVKISGHLLEENIVLGKKIKIKTLPMLDVRSNDVSASHGARIEKLDEKKLFYMRSKGLSKQQAEELMIEGYIEQMFAPIVSEENEKEMHDMKASVLEYLLS